MSDHFLTDIEITEFKCFKNFKASGFKHVNLIGGKNNIAKTAFMEACIINKSIYILHEGHKNKAADNELIHLLVHL